MSLRGFTSKDLRRGTDSINNSYVFLFFALFFSIILLNVTRSCKKQHREIHYSSSLKCSLFKELTNMNKYLQQTPRLRKQLLKWYHIHYQRWLQQLLLEHLYQIKKQISTAEDLYWSQTDQEQSVKQQQGLFTPPSHIQGPASGRTTS